MTTTGQPAFRLEISSEIAAAGPIAIVVSRYNETITASLRDAAVETLHQAGFGDDSMRIVEVPGAWEIPLAARWLCETGRFQAIICLGAVIRGETSHDQHLNRFVSMSLGDLALQSGMPVAFGVLTCNDLQQAQQRSGGTVGNKGHEAASAVLEMLQLKRNLNAEFSRTI